MFFFVIELIEIIFYDKIEDEIVIGYLHFV